MFLSIMRTLFALLCLIAVFDVNAIGPSRAQSALGRSDSTENVAARLPRKFGGNSRTRRVHIENQHGFDGKVEKIHINSDEDLPGIRAYGMQKKHLVNNGHIESGMAKDSEEAEDNSRVARSIEAYGKSKEHLEMNGHIERGHAPLSSPRHRPNPDPRARRSIETPPKQNAPQVDLEDLEAQDAKVFRPLFLYRQQLARRQHRGRSSLHKYYFDRELHHRNLRPVF